MNVDDGQFSGRASGQSAVDALTQIALERERTRRLLIGAACLFFVVAALVMVFAPPEKQTLGYALGAVMVVVALGAIGASQFHFKLPGISVQTTTVRSAGSDEAALHAGDTPVNGTSTSSSRRKRPRQIDWDAEPK
jgi:hypothetical protein